MGDEGLRGSRVGDPCISAGGVYRPSRRSHAFRKRRVRACRVLIWLSRRDTSSVRSRARTLEVRADKQMIALERETRESRAVEAENAVLV
jgi:hypothetical protein